MILAADSQGPDQTVRACPEGTFSLGVAHLTFCMLGNFAYFFVVCGLFLLNEIFQKNLPGIPSECQTVWIQIRPDILSGLIWVQTVCKGYQQTTKVATSGERVNVTQVNT